MKFLLDNSVSFRIAEPLAAQGFDVRHVRDYSMAASPDEAIFSRAADEDRVVIAADTDFGTLLALRQETKPSVILFRGASPRRPQEQAAALLANLGSFAEDLESGAIVVLDGQRIRIRRLPIR